MMILSFKSKALKAFWKTGDWSKLRPDWVPKLEYILDTLDQAGSPQAMDIQGFGFHPLKGDRKGTFSVWINRNWRVTFKFEGEDAIDVDMEDYHG
jgi:toxin HigB-1